MNEAWGYLTRSSGTVATVLIVAALAWGLFFSARATGERRRPNWWLDLHNYLGGLAFVFTIIHIVASYQAPKLGVGVSEVFVPLSSDVWKWGLTWGVLATYIFAAVVFTSWPKKLFPRKVWLSIHLLSIPGTIFAATHAWMIGSSTNGLWFKALLAVLGGLAVYPIVIRIASAITKRRTKRLKQAAAQ